MISESDVLIIGGGPAGLAAAMALGRMSRQALVCDDGRPRNAPAEHMNNFPSHDGLPPAEWRATVKKELSKYESIQFYRGSIVSLTKEGNVFRAQFTSGEFAKFRKVILAYGVVDQMPPIENIKTLWGKSVFHCPYCHGFEVRGKKLGLIASGPFAEHLLPMIYNLSKDVVLFSNGNSDLSPNFRDQLRAKGLSLIETKISSLEHKDLQLKKVHLANGESVERDFVFLAPVIPFQFKAPFAESLACEKDEMGFVKVNFFGKTSVEGIFAAGDLVTKAHSVLNAASSGQIAGAGVAAELVNEDFFDSGVKNEK